MILVFAILVLAGALACMAGAGHQRERSLEARRVFNAFFCACAGANFVVGLVALDAHHALAELIGLVAGAVLVSGAFRWARSTRTAR